MQQPGAIQGRSDYVEAVQCPCCKLYFGLFIESPMDPQQTVRIATIRPEDSKKVHKQLIEQWRKQGTLARENNVPVGRGTTQ